MVTPIVYTTPAFSRSKTFENAVAVLVWKKNGVVFQCKRTKTETFENDGVAAHIRSAYPWWPCKH